MDMWTYDINKEDWSPVSFQSSVVPSSRSEFSHARYQEDFIISEVKEIMNYIMIYIDIVLKKESGRLYL
jgi:hypothetical protein